MVVLLALSASAGVHSASADLPRGEQRALPVRATWADGEGPMPVIVFSHGMGGSRSDYDPLVQAWAEAGYLVLQPTHPDSLAFRSQEERRRFLRDPASLFTDPVVVGAFDDRVDEVAMVLDRLDGLKAPGLDVSRIDRGHVGIAGHSYGAHTAMLCGGLRLAGSARDFTEERADALLLLSPQGPAEVEGVGITRDSYAGITLPALVVTGSKDVSPRTGQGPAWRLEAFEHLGSKDKWLLWLDGAGHELGGIGGRGRPDRADLEAVIRASTALWDLTLRGDEAARARLDAATTARP